MDQITLHEDVKTHLWYGTFAELAAEQISPTEDRVLILSEIEGQSTTLQEQIEDVLDTQISSVTRYGGNQDDLPMSPDTFDVTILSSPPHRKVFERHKPLYEASSVTRQGGTIVYRAEQGLPHSDAVRLDQILALDWETDTSPFLAAEMTVTVDGEYLPHGKNEELDVNVPVRTDQPEQRATEHEQSQSTENATFEQYA